MKTVFGFVVIGAGVYLLVLFFLYMFQERLIFLPSAGLTDTPAAAGLEYEEIYLDTEDGIRIHGWWVESEFEKPAVIFFHGNAGNISGRVSIVEAFHRLGYPVFIVDYRGYGLSEGRPSEEGLYKDADAVWKWVADKGFSADEIVVVGRSMGGAIAAYVAAKYQPAALALESTFTSIADIAAGIYPIFPVRLLARVEMPTLEFMNQFDGPVLIGHSPADEVVPYSHGRNLLDEAGDRATWFELEGGHNDGFFRSRNAWDLAYGEFLDKIRDGLKEVQ